VAVEVGGGSDGTEAVVNRSEEKLLFRLYPPLARSLLARLADSPPFSRPSCRSSIAYRCLLVRVVVVIVAGIVPGVLGTDAVLFPSLTGDVERILRGERRLKSRRRHWWSDSVRRWVAWGRRRVREGGVVT
jgi:hypothetical protein